jgi:peptidyl-prolyl cis-trans isomerase A (cyclophilin A)
MNKIGLIFCLVFICACKQGNKHPQITITTQLGNIEAELYEDKAPKTVAAFLSYVDAGLFTTSSFYRVLLTEDMVSNNNAGLIQGGIWQSNNTKAVALSGIAHESTHQTGLSHTSGTLSLARSKVGTANSEFFICIGNQTQFDSSSSSTPDGLGFAAFGKVISGMSVVREIQKQAASGESFTKPVTIVSIKRQ